MEALRADGGRRGEWRKLSGGTVSHSVALVRAAARFVDGDLVERSKEERVAA